MGQYGLMGNYSADPSLGKFGGLQQGASGQSAQGGINPFTMMAIMKMLGMGGQQQEEQGRGGGIINQQQPFIPAQLQPFRQMPSYGNIISEMLARQRGF